MPNHWSRSSDTIGEFANAQRKDAAKHASPFDSTTDKITDARSPLPDSPPVDTRYHRYRNANNISTRPLGEISNPGHTGSGIQHSAAGISTVIAAENRTKHIYDQSHTEKDTKSSISFAEGGVFSSNPIGFGEKLERPMTAQEKYGAYAGTSVAFSPEGLTHTTKTSEFGFRYSQVEGDKNASSGHHPSFDHFSSSNVETGERDFFPNAGKGTLKPPDSMQAQGLSSAQAHRKDFWHSERHFEKDTQDNFVGGGMVISPKAKEVDFWHSPQFGNMDTKDNLGAGMVPVETAKSEDFWHGASNNKGATYKTQLYADDSGFGSAVDPCPSHPIRI